MFSAADSVCSLKLAETRVALELQPVPTHRPPKNLLITRPCNTCQLPARLAVLSSMESLRLLPDPTAHLALPISLSMIARMFGWKVYAPGLAETYSDACAFVFALHIPLSSCTCLQRPGVHSARPLMRHCGMCLHLLAHTFFAPTSFCRSLPCTGACNAWQVSCLVYHSTT